MLTDAQKKFIEDLLASQIVTVQEIKDWGSEATGTTDAESFADKLVKSGKLTNWQAKYLLGGRTRLRFGNYVLTDRLGRDELGDSFLGKHDKLHRSVRLFFLSTEHSKSLANNERLIRELALATDVDHPNLEQVHLIDQDTGRYMFVTERLDGRNLSDSDLLTELEADQIPSLLKQTIAGLLAAHQSGLYHGKLSDDNVYVIDGDNVKLEGFLKSNLHRNLIEETGAAAADDIKALKQLAKRLVKRFPSEEAKLILADLALSENPSDLHAIAGKQYLKKPQAADIKFTAPSTPERAVAQPTRHTKSRPARTSLRSPAEPQSNLVRNLMWASTGILAVIALILVGPKLLGRGNSDNAQAKSDSANESTELPTLPAGLSSSRDSDHESVAPNPLPDKNKTENSDSVPTDGGDQVVGINLENSGDDVDLDGEDLDLESTDLDMPKQESPSQAVTASESSSSLLDKFKASSDESDSDSNEKEKPSHDYSNKDSVNPQVMANDQAVAEKAAPIANVSTTFPSATDLPPNTITDGLGIVNFGDQQVTALGLELLSDNNVSTKSRIKLELSGERNRSWDVSLTNSQSKTKVGQFVWDDNQLNFQWYPEAAELPDANYLRNCILKINDGTGTKYLPLRKPVIIPGFVLQRENPRLKVDIDNLEYLPKGAIAELHELDSEKYGQIYFGDGVADQTFSRKQPLTLMFSEVAEYQLVMMTLNAELKNKSKLEAILQVRLAPDQKPKLANDKTMESAKQFLEQYVVDVTNNYERLRKMKIDDLRKQLNMTKEQLPNTEKKARERQLKEEIEFAKKRAEIFRETQSKLATFFQNPIPVSIYYRLGDHRVVLATTVTSGG